MVLQTKQRNADIPEYLNLTFGEPYDSVFKHGSRMAPYGDGTLDIANSILYQLLISQKGLGQFLALAIDFEAEQEDTKVKKLNLILNELGIAPIYEYENSDRRYAFYKILKEMIPLAKIYLAIKLEEDYQGNYDTGKAIFKENLNLTEYLETREL
jgi:hypothetical protein